MTDLPDYRAVLLAPHPFWATLSPTTVKQRIEQLYALPTAELPLDEANAAFAELRRALNRGQVRSAEPDGSGEWRVNQWVKQGILVGFRAGSLADVSTGGFPFFDKANLPVRSLAARHRITKASISTTRITPRHC